MSYSRFFLCDLHVHTVADPQQQYGQWGGRDPNPKFAERLIRAHADAGVKVIAVTDHNRVDWYPSLAEAGERQGVFVFPGLEFSVNGCHLTAVWDRSELGFQSANHFLEQLRGPGSTLFRANGDPIAITHGGQVSEWAAKAVEYGAMVLAPHATSKKNGIFGPGICSNSDEIAQSDYISGYDVVGNSQADVLINPASQFAASHPRWFIAGDVRCFDDVGARAVYLKVDANPSLEGLRQAFMMPHVRIRFPHSLAGAYQHVKGVEFISTSKPDCPRINALTISGGFHDQIRIAFGPGLNAIIGGKGSGKSAMLEIVRWVLGAREPVIQD